MGGHKRTLDDDQWRHDNWVGVTFGVGRYKVGDIDQYCSVWDAHWGNGIAGAVPKYDRANVRLAALEKKGTWNPRPQYSPQAHSLDSGVMNLLNASGPCIEHEDATKDEPWPEPLVQNSIMVHQWIDEEFKREGWPFTWNADALVGHFQIDAVNRLSCPSYMGKYWPKARILASVKKEEEDMTIVACADSPHGFQNWALGSGNPRLIGSAAELTEAVKLFGPAKPISWGLLKTLGAT